MDRVCDRLWIGAAEDGRDIDKFRACGITAVLNVTEASDGWAQGTKEEIPYVRLGQADGQPIPREVLVEAGRFLMHAMLVERRTVLVHCGAGVSRAATFCIFWLMLCGFGWDEAEALVRAPTDLAVAAGRRSQPIAPNPVLKTSVLAYFGKEG